MAPLLPLHRRRYRNKLASGVRNDARHLSHIACDTRFMPSATLQGGGAPLSPRSAKRSVVARPTAGGSDSPRSISYEADTVHPPRHRSTLWYPIRLALLGDSGHRAGGVVGPPPWRNGGGRERRKKKEKVDEMRRTGWDGGGGKGKCCRDVGQASNAARFAAARRRGYVCRRYAGATGQGANDVAVQMLGYFPWIQSIVDAAPPTSIQRRSTNAHGLGRDRRRRQAATSPKPPLPLRERAFRSAATNLAA